MKRVIRENVFETNSSSNHAVFIKRLKEGKKIPDYAVSTPYDKMLFMWGLFSSDTVKSLFRLRISDEQGIEFRDILIDECLKYQSFDVEKAKELMDKSFNTSNSDKFTCNMYFGEGLLNDCTCFFSINNIAKFFEIKNFNCYNITQDKFKEVVEKFFADDKVYILPICCFDMPNETDYD